MPAARRRLHYGRTHIFIVLPVGMPTRFGSLSEGAAEGPVFDRVFLAGDDLQRDFFVAGGEEGDDPVFNFLFGAGDRREPDQIRR